MFQQSEQYCFSWDLEPRLQHYYSASEVSNHPDQSDELLNNSSTATTRKAEVPTAVVLMEWLFRRFDEPLITFQ